VYDYWTPYGFPRAYKGERSETPVMFLAVWYYLFNMVPPHERCTDIPPDVNFTNVNETLKKWLTSNKGELRTVNHDLNPRFSLDNAVSFVCLSRLCGFDYRPFLGLNKHYSIHPKEFFFFLYAKYPLIGWLFLWIPMLAMMVSCWQEYKVRNGHYIVKVDGKILMLLRCKAFNLRITEWICTRLILRQIYYDSLGDLFYRYFRHKYTSLTDWDHPINILAKKVYND